ncbi:MAG: hypothetical protein SCM96_11945 [Acidobacteriota bacterium]|nr:hypothetical protein [Acidobacteriota bacterium]
MIRPGKLRTAVRAGLKSNFGLSILKYRLFKQKKDRWLVPAFGLAAAGILPALYGWILLIQGAYVVLAPLNQQRALLSLGILAGQIVVLLFGIFYVISAFYFSRDMEMLIPLPFRPGEIMAGKFAVIMINEYLTVALFVLPVVITYGVLDKAGLGYWVSAVLVYLALPVIPLAAVSVAVVVLMRFVNISRKKDALILAGAVLLLGLVFSLQFALGRSAASGELEAGAQAVIAFFTSPNSLLNRVGAVFPPGIWATKAVSGGFSGEGLSNLFIFLGVSIALFAGLVAAAEGLFFKGVIGLGETTAKKRRLTRGEMSRRLSSGRRATSAIFRREWRLMNRTPIFLLNGTLVAFIFPVLFVLMTSFNSGGDESGGGPMFLLRALMAANPLIVILGTALLMIVCGSLNGTSSSTFSREGSQFWISRIIPVAPREQAAAKFLHSYLVAVLGVVTAGATAAFFLHVKAVHLAAAAALALAAGALLTAVGMIIDLARPLLDWTNPQKAIKQNLNVLLALLADIGILTAVFFGIKAMMKAGWTAPAVLGGLFVALSALAAVVYAVLLRFADRRYPEIEN